MAELVGLVAGGAGLASLSIQLLESAKKLERLYSNFKGAPKRLTRLSREIETIRLSLKLAGADVCEDDGSDFALNLTMAIRMCQESVVEVEEATTKLEALCARSRQLGRMAVALHESKLRDLCDELESGKNSLALAFSIVSDWRRQQSEARTHQALANIGTMIRQVPQDTWLYAPQPVQVSPPQGTGHIEHESGDVEDVVPRQATKKARKRQSFIKIRLPCWISSRIWLLGMNRAETGWDVSLRTMNMVPQNAPIFIACEDGDLVTARRLLTNGEASIHDTTVGRYGGLVTPLQLAAESRNIDLCRSLLAAGRRADQWHVSRAAMNCWISEGYLPSYSDSIEVEALMFQDLMLHEDFLIEDLERDGFNLDDPLCRGPWNDLTDLYIWLSADRLRWVKQHLAHPYSSWPLLARIQIADEISKANMKPSCWMELCELPKSVEMLKSLTNMEKSCLFSLLVPRPEPDVDQDMWIDYAVSLNEGNEVTALLSFLRLRCVRGDDGKDPTQTLKRRLGEWLQALLRQGVNLKHFGKKVKAQLACSTSETWIAPILDSDPHFRISDVLHGPSYNDWGLKFVCGRPLVIHHLRSTPGSFPKDFPLPGTIWGNLTASDLQRGSWVPETVGHIESVQQIQVANNDEDDFVDVLCRLCTETKDDHCPSLPSTRRQDFAERTMVPGRRRSRSQTAFQRAAERADVTYRRVNKMYTIRYGHELGVCSQQTSDALIESLTVPSVFEGIRLTWFERLRCLCYDEEGLKACGCDDKARASRFNSGYWQWPSLDPP